MAADAALESPRRRRGDGYSEFAKRLTTLSRPSCPKPDTGRGSKRQGRASKSAACFASAPPPSGVTPPLSVSV
jgi:hypothetical protein